MGKTYGPFKMTVYAQSELKVDENMDFSQLHYSYSINIRYLNVYYAYKDQSCWKWKTL